MARSPPPDFSVAVIGGGLAGLTLSIGLTRYGISHQIYESAKCFSEIGAGICMGPNAITALTLIDPRIKECYDRCATYNEDPDRRKGWLSFRYGMAQGKNMGNDRQDVDFGDLITNVDAYSMTEEGRSCVHRAKFLDEVTKLVPEGTAAFGKTMKQIRETEKDVEISFEDGTTAHASALIACDGIKSLTRKYVLGPSDSSIEPVFANEYAYRALLPRVEANAILGSDQLAGNGNLYCGQNGYVIHYPVEHGALVNVVAIKRATSDFAISANDSWLVPCSREAMLSDFENWGDPILQVLGKVRDSSRWALFDSPPARTFCRGRVCLMGDAAHASTPNQGAGAGMAFEDAFIMSGLLADVRNEEPKSVERTFQAFDTVRRPRTQRLVATSREAGKLYEFAIDGIGDDLVKIKEDLERRHDWIWKVDLLAELERARRMTNMDDLLPR